MRARSLALAGVLLLALGWSVPAWAQGRISGTVTSADGSPIQGAVVRVVNASGQQAGAATTGADGSFAVVNVAAGTYSVAVSAIGYRPGRTAGVVVGAGATVAVNLVLTAAAIELDPVVVSATRRQERAINTPAAVAVVPTAQITERPALTVTDHLKSIPGVDISTGGLVQSNVVGRGFNNIFSGALLTLTDYRYASVPSLRVNVPAFFSINNEDIERIEMVGGPGAALYGPNSANGVLSIITKSPITSPGTSVWLDAGFRSGSRTADGTSLDDAEGLAQISLRHAAAVSPRFGYKISGSYLRGTEWRGIDTAEPQTLPGRSCTAETKCRDFTLEKYSFDLRADYRPTPDAEIVAAYGRTTSPHLIEYTGVGAAQAEGWTYDFMQLRGRSGKLFAQAFMNRSDAGTDDATVRQGSFLLRSGDPVFDKSRVIGLQAQHGFEVGRWQDVIYGVDYTYTDARTGRTINGRNEDDDSIKEIGGYVNSTTRLTDQVDFIGALRVDKHSRLEKAVFSPRAALVLMPSETQSVRLTYNRAFSTPSNNNLFLDLVVQPLPGTPYKVRALGVPQAGFTFRGHCGSGGVDNLCMWPGQWGAGVPNQALPANAATLWSVAMNIVSANPALAALRPVLLGIPAPTTNVTQLARLVGTRFLPIAPTDVRDIATLEPSITNAFEVGYKGIFQNKFRMAIDVYYQKKENFVGPLIVESPNVFISGPAAAAYLTAALTPVLGPAAGPTAAQVAAGLAQIPLATIIPGDPLTQSSDLFVTYRNFGSVDLWGADLAMDYFIDSHWSVAGHYSLTSDDFFPRSEVGGPVDIALNGSKSKGGGAVRYRDDDSGVSTELRGRFVKGFPIISGVYVSQARADGSLEPINSYGLLDAQVSWKVPGAANFRATLSVDNVFNKNYQTFVGLPQLGRLVMTKLQVGF